MSASIITKIEYREIGSPDYLVLDIIPYSGKLKEDITTSRAGDIYTCVIDFNVVLSSLDNDSIVKPLANQRTKYQYRITDANGTIYEVGSERFPARLIYQRAIDGTPGSFGGYHCTITHKSSNGCTVS